MTILKPNLTEKKDENDLHLPEVVTDSMLLIENEKNEAKVGVSVIEGNRVVSGHRKHACLILVLVPLALVLFAASIWILQHLQRQQELEYVGWCGVEFMQKGDSVDKMLPLFGQFEQEVTITGRVEHINVPRIGDTNQATILHDFNTNWTVIVDKDMGHCFILALDRSLVMPPTDFFDLLLKLKSGYLLVDVELLRANYKAITPPVDDWSTYGEHITSECVEYPTYRLAKQGEPVAMSKRSACEFVGEKYCLGDAGFDKMLCLRITACY